MKTKLKLHLLLLAGLSTLNSQLSTIFAQGTAFTYQGRLNDGASPATGSYDFRFRVAMDPSANEFAAPAILTNGVPVVNGLFTVTLDFGGGVFTGAERWLFLSVKTNGAVNFTPLTPLHKITATPYAITAGNLNGPLSSDSLSGTYANAVTLNNGANSFSGNGASLTSLNASNLTGALADARLSPNVALRGGGNAFTGNQTIAGSVGIGTTSPAASLEVNGGVRARGGSPGGFGANNNGYAFSGNGGDDDSGMFSSANGQVEFHANSLERMRITEAGNVGIGTIAPVSALQVNGTVTAPSFSGTAGTTLMLGTTDNQAVELRANALRGWRVEPDPRAGGIAANLIGGSTNNTIEGRDSGGSVIVGGGWLVQPNVVHSNSSGVFIGAGSGNHIGPNVNDAVIGGGNANSNAGLHSVISGGERNAVQVHADHAAIGGGGFNTITGSAALPGYGVIAGGRFNSIRTNSSYATVGGGINNSSAGEAATVPGGAQNSALGHYSFAAGHFAYASHQGAFVWADSENSLFPSTTQDQFSVRAKGGVRLVTGGAGMTLDGARVPVPQTTIDDATHSNIVNVVNGSPVNFILNGVYGATIAGGGAEKYPGYGNLRSSVSADFGTVSGGGGNRVTASWGTVGGGDRNTSSGNGATVGGGEGNTSSGSSATIAGGAGNLASGDWAAIGGGFDNRIQPNADYATIGGGFQNTAQANAEYPTIGGGVRNTIQTNADYATIGGGFRNTIQPEADRATIGGGYFNTIETAVAATIGGGFQNTIRASAYSATIGGGDRNTIETNALYATIGGGVVNTNHASFATIAGGYFNTIETNAGSATIAGGSQNTIQTNAGSATIAGGSQNTIETNAAFATIAGGYFNTIETKASAATIGGGDRNTIQTNAVYATIPGGAFNSAASHAFAAGYRAKANHPGSFVWADLQFFDFESTANNQFLIRADGGVGINTTNPGAMLQVGDPITPGSQGMIRFASHSGGTGAGSRYWDIGVPQDEFLVDGKFFSFVIDDPRLGTDPEVVVRWDTGNVGIGVNHPTSKLHVGAGGVRCEMGLGEKFSLGGNGSFEIDAPGILAGRFVVQNGGNVGIGTASPQAKLDVIGDILASGSICADNGFQCISDRNAKTGFAPVDAKGILEKVAALSITRWRYTNDTTTPHLGPVAQDFHAAFGLGSNDKTIATVDADGVALAAIQGLNQKVEEKEARISALEKELSELKQAVKQLSEGKN